MFYNVRHELFDFIDESSTRILRLKYFFVYCLDSLEIKKKTDINKSYKQVRPRRGGLNIGSVKIFKVGGRCR